MKLISRFSGANVWKNCARDGKHPASCYTITCSVAHVAIEAILILSGRRRDRPLVRVEVIPSAVGAGFSLPLVGGRFEDIPRAHCPQAEPVAGLHTCYLNPVRAIEVVAQDRGTLDKHDYAALCATWERAYLPGEVATKLKKVGYPKAQNDPVWQLAGFPEQF